MYETDMLRGIDRINEVGKEFLKVLGVAYAIDLTQKQVYEILSIQERLKKTDNNQWKIVDKKGGVTWKKKKRGGHLDFEKWKTRFFASTK